MLTPMEVADWLRAHENYLILTHKRPDGDTLGCAAALAVMLRALGKRAGLLPNAEVTERYAPYVDGLWAAEDYTYDTVVSVDLAALSLFPDNAAALKTRVDLAIDHHPSYEGFAKESCVYPERAACGEILYEIATALGALTPAVALALYVAVSTDTGCFVYSNVTANTHRVAAALLETGIDVRGVNKALFRTKSRKRLALEGRLLREMEFFDGGRVVVVRVPLSLRRELALTENDMDDLAALGGLVEGQDCSVTMKELDSGDWKVSVRTGPRVNATAVCARFGGGGHRAASGCVIHGMTGEDAKRAIVAACIEVGAEAAAKNENGLVALTERERLNLSGGAHNKIVSTFDEAMDFIRGALENRHSSERAYLGKITDAAAQKVLFDTGVNVRGYNVILPSDNVRHIIKKHGSIQTECVWEQVPVAPEDIALIPYVLSAPDSVRLSDQTDSRGRSVLIFEKQLEDHFITMQAISDGTISLRTDTLYIKKRKSSQDTGYNADKTADPAHNARSVPPQSSFSYDPTIPQPSKIVKNENGENNA